MANSRMAIAIPVGAIALMFAAPQPASTQPLPAPTPTRDAATATVNTDLMTPPGVAILVGAQGSSNLAFRARTLIACDQSVSKDLKGPGDFGLASAPGKHVYVCSYSISNGSTVQDVQFVSGTEASSGYGSVCSPGLPVTARFHLVSNQFVSQGSGVGSLFVAPGQGLCLRVTGKGDVGVNVTYASF